MGRLDGKTAVITGGNGGFGSETAVLFAKEGADVLICGRNEKTLEEARQKVADEGHLARSVRCDVAKEEDVKRMFEVLDSEFGHVDILVNNAGVSKKCTLVEHPSEMWHEIMSANLDSTFYCCKEAAIRMQKQRTGGAIINLGSIAGMTNREGSVAYAASKAGIVGLTRCIAGELAGDGIRVNAICPGPVPTPVFKDFPREVQEQLMSTIKLNRWGSTMDIANLILFLASDEGSWITGEAININGGAFMG